MTPSRGAALWSSLAQRQRWPCTWGCSVGGGNPCVWGNALARDLSLLVAPSCFLEAAGTERLVVFLNGDLFRAPACTNYCPGISNAWQIVAHSGRDCPGVGGVALNNICRVTVTMSSAEGRNLDAAPLFVKASSQTDKAWRAFCFPSGGVLRLGSFFSARLHQGYFLWEAAVCGYVHVRAHTLAQKDVFS